MLEHLRQHHVAPLARAFRDELSFSFAIGDGMRLRRRLLRLVTDGALDPTVVIDARGRLEDAPALYTQLAKLERMKAVLTV